MDMNIRDELAEIIADETADNYHDGARNAADAIIANFGVVPLAGVMSSGGNSGGVWYGNALATHAYVHRPIMRTYAGYWNLAQGDDPTPAIAAMILAMREAQGVRDA